MKNNEHYIFIEKYKSYRDVFALYKSQKTVEVPWYRGISYYLFLFPYALWLWTIVLTANAVSRKAVPIYGKIIWENPASRWLRIKYVFLRFIVMVLYRFYRLCGGESKLLDKWRS